MHTLHVEAERLQAAHATLAAARAGLVTALGGEADAPPPLAHAVASQHEHWLAYVEADCELAGTLTGAGGSWPAVHGLSCQNQRVAMRIGEVERAATCVRGLQPTDTYGRYGCLQGLVHWSLGGE